jgi:Ras-related protein Rab-6A
MEIVLTDDDFCFYDICFQILLIGDSNVGKTTFLKKLLKNDDKIYNTHGIDYNQLIIKTEDNKRIKILIYDTGGSEKYMGLIKSYYRQCIGIIFFFDTTNDKSLKNIENWIQQFEKEVCETLIESKIDTLLVENKMDLLSVINKEEKELLTTKYNFDLFQISINHNYIDIKNIIYCLTTKILKNQNNDFSKKVILPDECYDNDSIIVLETEEYEILINKEFCSCSIF